MLSAEIDPEKGVKLIRNIDKKNWVKRLLQRKNKEGQTVLHIASKQGNVKMVEHLLREGADLSTKNKTGHSALYELVCSIESPADKGVELVNNLADSYVQNVIKGIRKACRKNDNEGDKKNAKQPEQNDENSSEEDGEKDDDSIKEHDRKDEKASDNRVLTTMQFIQIFS